MKPGFRPVYRTIWFALFACILLSAKSQTAGSFRIRGNIQGMDNGWIYLSYINSEGKPIRDSAQVRMGNFSFQGLVKEPTIASFYGKMAGRGVDDPDFSNIFLEPGDIKVDVKLHEFKLAKVQGSASQDEYAQVQAAKQKIQQRWKLVLDTLSAVNRRSNFAYQELKNWVLVPYFEEMKEVDLDFFQRFPKSYVTAYMLRFRSRELCMDSLQMYYDRLPLQVRNSSYGTYVEQEIAKKKIGIPGTMAALFTSRSLDGNELGLADYRGKYVLLDFWASWCLPCRKGNPHLRQLYARYKPLNFEVIGVASDDGHEDKWKAAIAQDSIAIWKHVLTGYDPVKRDNSHSIGTLYSIESLPTQILINPEGLIIGRFGEGEEEARRLDSMLKGIFKL